MQAVPERTPLSDLLTLSRAVDVGETRAGPRAGTPGVRTGPRSSPPTSTHAEQTGRYDAVVVRTPKARFLQHATCRGRLEPFVSVELTFGGATVDARGPLAATGTDTHPLWPRHRIVARLPPGLADALDAAAAAASRVERREDDTDAAFDARRRAAALSVAERAGEPPKLVVSARASTVALKADLIGSATVPVPWNTLVGRRECGDDDDDSDDDDDECVELLDGRGRVRGELLVSCYRRSAEPAREVGGGALFLTVPEDAGLDPEKRRPRALRATLDRGGDAGPVEAVREVPVRVFWPATVDERVSLTLAQMGPDGKGLAGDAAVLDDVVSRAVQSPGETFEASHRLADAASAPPTKISACFLEHTRGSLVLSVLDVDLDEAAADEAAALTESPAGPHQGVAWASRRR